MRRTLTLLALFVVCLAIDPRTEAQQPVVYEQPHARVFTLINWHRSQRGLRPLRYDTNLAAWAARNNSGQLYYRRSGHHVNPNCWQVAFYGPQTADLAVNGWLASPSHFQAIMRPDVTVIGVAVNSVAWTANLR